MANNGWVKNYRKIEEWEWYTTPHMAHLWQHLIRAANHKDGRWQGQEVKKGQLICGLHTLSAATGISVRSLRTCLTRLEQSREITRKSTNRFSVITINKYCEYQTEEEQTDKQPTSDRQATDKQPTTNKNEKNERMKDSCANALQKRAHCAPVNEEAFSLFWEAYPKKRDKLKARKVWDKIKADSELTQQILTAVSLQAKTRDWTKEDGKYIPLPTTWLNGRRWEDEIETKDTDEWQ